MSTETIVALAGLVVTLFLVFVTHVASLSSVKTIAQNLTSAVTDLKLTIKELNTELKNMRSQIHDLDKRVTITERFHASGDTDDSA